MAVLGQRRSVFCRVNRLSRFGLFESDAAPISQFPFFQLNRPLKARPNNLGFSNTRKLESGGRHWPGLMNYRAGWV